MKRLLALTALAFVVRLQLSPSAYGDEALYITAGRLMLRTKDSRFNLSGTYIWPIIAGALDLEGARIVAALCGALMVMFTALYAEERRWLAAAPMCLCAAPVAVGRMATHDALSAALAMGGVVLWKRRRSLFAAGALFLGFLTKYTVALLFPMLCLLGPSIAFVAPLALGSAAFFFGKQAQMTHAIAVPLTYLPMKDDVLLHLVLLRPEVWVVLAFALVSKKRAAPVLAAITVLSFALFSRQDTSFWKYAPYILFFSAPGFADTWSRLFRGFALPAAYASAALCLPLTSFIFAPYPDVSSIAAALQARLRDARHLASDDGALRHTLDKDDERLDTPYKTGVDVIAARRYDAIVLDGGSSPFEASLAERLDLRPYEVDFYAPLPKDRALSVHVPRHERTAREPLVLYGRIKESVRGPAFADWTGTIATVEARLRAPVATQALLRLIDEDGKSVATQHMLAAKTATPITWQPPPGRYRRIVIEVAAEQWWIDQVYATPVAEK